MFYVGRVYLEIQEGRVNDKSFDNIINFLYVDFIKYDFVIIILENCYIFFFLLLNMRNLLYQGNK